MESVGSLIDFWSWEVCLHQRRPCRHPEKARQVLRRFVGLATQHYAEDYPHVVQPETSDPDLVKWTAVLPHFGDELSSASSFGGVGTHVARAHAIGKDRAVSWEPLPESMRTPRPGIRARHDQRHQGSRVGRNSGSRSPAACPCPSSSATGLERRAPVRTIADPTMASPADGGSGPERGPSSPTRTVAHPGVDDRLENAPTRRGAEYAEARYWRREQFS